MTPHLPRTLHIATPTDTTIVLTRAFQAPRRLVWEALFTPARMRRWMLPPPGCTMTVCECDPRVGGMLRLAWRSADADPAMTLTGVFTEVVLHERMVHTETIALASGQIVSELVEAHAFADAGGGTLMRITQTYPSRAARDEAVASGMDHGLEAGFAALEQQLGSPGHPAA